MGPKRWRSDDQQPEEEQLAPESASTPTEEPVLRHEDGSGATEMADPGTDASTEEAAQEEPTPEPEQHTLGNGVTFLLGSWKELPNYICPACGYANLSVEDFSIYQAKGCRRAQCPIPKAAAPEDAPREVAPVLDRFGNLIYRQEE